VTLNGLATCIRETTQSESDSMWMTRTVVTDASGGFAFPRLPAGVFKISVQSPLGQFLATNYGERRPGGQGQSIQLADGQKIALKVPMMRGGVIAGTVRGPDGEPQRNIQVRALRYDRSSGFKRLQSVSYAKADDRGAYRLFGLQPGDYIISATPNAMDSYQIHRGAENEVIERAIQSAPATAARAAGLPTIAVPVTPQPNSDMTRSIYLPTYAPSATLLPDATTVTVAGNEERTGVDIQVQFVLAGMIQGVVSTPLDRSVKVQLWLIADDGPVENSYGIMQQPNQEGVFTFRAVSPGTYTVFAQTFPIQPDGPQLQQVVLTDAQKMWGKTQVTVSSDTTVRISLDLQPSRSISGIVTFNTRQRPDFTQSHFTVVAQLAPSPQQMYFSEISAAVGADGRFTITGVPAGRYVLHLSDDGLQSSVVLRSGHAGFSAGLLGDRDVTDAVLTVSDRFGEVSGTLTDATGKPALDYTIIIAATDSRYWRPGSRRVRAARPSPSGDYEFGPLPPGSYQLSVVIDPDPGLLHDPEFLSSIARTSIPVTITRGRQDHAEPAREVGRHPCRRARDPPRSTRIPRLTYT
jgi:hypothetical protein